VKKFVEENPTPLKKYSIEEENGWISLPLTPGAKSQARVIYMFRSKSDGKVLIGKTEAKVGKRVSQYVSSFNHPEKERGNLPLPMAVRNNPRDFEFGILAHVSEDLDLGAIEAAYINVKKALTHGYNQRNGGGGGHARPKVSKEKTDATIKNLFADFTSPEKKPLKKDKKGVSLPLSAKTKKTKQAIYVFKSQEKRYIGKTIREVSKRVSEHLHFANHPEKERGKKPLYQDMRTQDFSFGLLYKAKKGDEDVNLDAIEKAFIEYYDSTKTGYNGNKGGGGG
jgi:predicted GIY-YIG superfamily endonuclease